MSESRRPYLSDGGRSLLRRRARISWTALIVGGALVALVGCGSKEKPPEWTPDTESRISPGDQIKVQGAVEWVEPTAVQEGVGLRAIAKGEVLAVYIRNGRESDFLLSPMDFAVIVGPNLYRVQTSKAGFRENRFPSPFRMQPGTSTAGLLRFPEAGDMTGGRLVFNNPEIGKPFYVAIEAAGEAESGTKP